MLIHYLLQHCSLLRQNFESCPLDSLFVITPSSSIRWWNTCQAQRLSFVRITYKTVYCIVNRKSLDLVFLLLKHRILQYTMTLFLPFRYHRPTNKQRWAEHFNRYRRRRLAPHPLLLQLSCRLLINCIISAASCYVFLHRNNSFIELDIHMKTIWNICLTCKTASSVCNQGTGTFFCAQRDATILHLPYIRQPPTTLVIHGRQLLSAIPPRWLRVQW